MKFAILHYPILQHISMNDIEDSLIYAYKVGAIGVYPIHDSHQWRYQN